MMPSIPVKDAQDWYRDSSSGSLQCANKSEYDKYMAAHRSAQVKEGEFKTLQNDVSELKSELGDIKSLLLTLVQNKKS